MQIGVYKVKIICIKAPKIFKNVLMKIVSSNSKKTIEKKLVK